MDVDFAHFGDNSNMTDLSGINSLLTAPINVQMNGQLSGAHSRQFHETPRIADRKRFNSFRRCLSLNASEESSPNSQQSFAQFRQTVVRQTIDECSPVLAFKENGENDSSAANCGPSSGASRIPQKRSVVSDSTASVGCGAKIRKSASLMTSSHQKRLLIQRCRSETEAQIMNAVQRSCEDKSLIGDFSRRYALPLIQGKNQDLNSINVDVLAALMRGEFASLIESCTIVDCRYPYEYIGGHIKGAKNIYTKDGIVKHFLSDFSLIPSHQDLPQDSHKHHILVFHCEFSSERGPALSRYLRSMDRSYNNYPLLHYPEVYILDGGYKAFFEKYSDLCDPPEYLPMHSKDHEEELRHFRAEVKNLNFDGKQSALQNFNDSF